MRRRTAITGIFNNTSSLDTSRSILCFLRAGARSGPNSYEVYDRPISFVPRWCMRVGAVSGESEPLSILLFGLLNDDAAQWLLRESGQLAVSQI